MARTYYVEHVTDRGVALMWDMPTFFIVALLDAMRYNLMPYDMRGGLTARVVKLPHVQ